MEIWQAIILGLVEGITEFLPVSSTGHLIIASSLMGLDTPDSINALNTFQIVIQGGAILAVLGLYRSRVMQMLRGLIGRDPQGLHLALLLVVAFLPAAVLGPLLQETIEANLFSTGPVILALALGGLWMILLDLRRRQAATSEAQESPESGDDPFAGMTYAQALGIGLLQCVAMWPGTSRSMMTIAGGTMLGLRPRDAAEFSFLLGLPTLGGACVYSLGKDYLGNEGDAMFSALGAAPVLIGMAVAAVSAAFAVRWLVTFLNRHGLALFGVYRLIIAAALWLMISQGLVNLTA